MREACVHEGVTLGPEPKAFVETNRFDLRAEFDLGQVILRLEMLKRGQHEIAPKPPAPMTFQNGEAADFRGRVFDQNAKRTNRLIPVPDEELDGFFVKTVHIFFQRDPLFFNEDFVAHSEAALDVLGQGNVDHAEAEK